MARPVSIQTNSILDTARKVFMRDGYQASTSRIAREARVSEGSVFKHFKSKANLFLAAMAVEAGNPAWEKDLLTGVGRVPPRKALESAGLQLLEQLRLTLPRLMMISASGVTIPHHDLPGEPPHPVQKMDVFCRYFKAEIQAGRMTTTSPKILAHLFLGALAHYAWCETLFSFRSAPPKVYVRTLVDTIIKATLIAPGSDTVRRGRKTSSTKRDKTRLNS